MAQDKDSHRHILPGTLLTGPPVAKADEEGTKHKHHIVGGEGWTTTDPGNGEDNHRHMANGQGTSGPTNTMRDTQLEDKPSGAKEARD